MKILCFLREREREREREGGERGRAEETAGEATRRKDKTTSTLPHREDLWNTNQAANAFGHAGVQLPSTRAGPRRTFDLTDLQTSCRVSRVCECAPEIRYRDREIAGSGTGPDTAQEIARIDGRVSRPYEGEIGIAETRATSPILGRFRRAFRSGDNKRNVISQTKGESCCLRFRSPIRIASKSTGRRCQRSLQRHHGEAFPPPPRRELMSRINGGSLRGMISGSITAFRVTA